MRFKHFINELLAYDPARADRIGGKIKAILNDQKGQTTIANTLWSDLKSMGNSYLENEWEKVQQVYLTIDHSIRNSQTDPEAESVQQIYYWSVQLHTFDGKEKLYNSKFKKRYKQDWVNKVFLAVDAFFKENSDMVKNILYWKDKAVKKERGEVVKARKTAEVHRIMATNADVKNVVTKIAEEFRPELEKEYSEWKLRILNNWNQDGRLLFDTRNYQIRQILGSLIDPATFDVKSFKKIPEGAKSFITFKLKSDFNKIIQREAKSEADFIIQDFTMKLVMKLNTIISKKGNLEDAKRTGVVNRNEIMISFTDGSKFTVRSKIVYVTNSNGTSFSRYPTTFHDTILPDGSKMSDSSEANMINKFANAKGE